MTVLRIGDSFAGITILRLIEPGMVEVSLCGRSEIAVLKDAKDPAVREILNRILPTSAIIADITVTDDLIELDTSSLATEAERLDAYVSTDVDEFGEWLMREYLGETYWGNLRGMGFTGADIAAEKKRSLILCQKYRPLMRDLKKEDMEGLEDLLSRMTLVRDQLKKILDGSGYLLATNIRAKS